MKTWTNCELAILKKHYPTNPIKKLIEVLPNKTKKQIKAKAHYLHIYKEYDRHWTDADIMILMEKYPTTLMDNLCKLFNRSKDVIRNKANDLGIYRTAEAIRIESSRGMKNINKGRKRPDLAERNKQNPLKGQKNPFYGKTHSKETREKISELQKTNSAFFRLNKDPSFQEIRKKAFLEAMANPKTIQNILRAQHIRPNIPERKMIELIEKYSLPFRYTGDGEEIIGNINPDFIHNNKKIIIEVFGDYWHNPNRKNISYKQTEEGRREYLSKQGYQLIVFWEHELKSNNEEVILSRLEGCL